MWKQVLFLVSVMVVSGAAQRTQPSRQSSQVQTRQMEGPPVFCTERDLPQSLNCNLERIYTYRPFVDKGQLDLFFIQFRFLPRGSSCNVSYIPEPMRQKVTFIYEGSNCYPIDVPLKDLKISRVSSFVVEFKGKDGYGCTSNHVVEQSNSGIVFQDRSAGRLVKYRFVDMICSDGSTTAVLDGSSVPDCKLDANNRCRPVG